MQDPKVIDSILGPNDAQRMKESMAVLQNSSADLDAKETAFENLEMLIEHIDNANNIENLKMWPDILAFLNDPNETMRLHSSWVIGTAVQNNPKAKADLLSHKEPVEPLSKLLEMLENDPDSGVRSKASYALSALIKHSPDTLAQFESKGGFDVFGREIDAAAKAIEAGNSTQESTLVNIARRIIFLIGSLLLEDHDAAADDHGKFDEAYSNKRVEQLDQTQQKSSTDSTSGKVKQSGLMSKIINFVKSEAYKPGAPETVDLDLIEKGLRTLLTYLQVYSGSSPLDERDRGMLSTFVLELRDRYGGGDMAVLDKSDWEELEKRVKT